MRPEAKTSTLLFASRCGRTFEEGDACCVEVESIHASVCVTPTQYRFVRVARVRPAKRNTWLRRCQGGVSVFNQPVIKTDRCEVQALNFVLTVELQLCAKIVNSWKDKLFYLIRLPKYKHKSCLEKNAYQFLCWWTKAQSCWRCAAERSWSPTSHVHDTSRFRFWANVATSSFDSTSKHNPPESQSTAVTSLTLKIEN